MLSVNLRWFLELQVLLVGPASNVHTHPCASDLSVSLFPDYPASFWLFHLHFGRYYFHCWIVLLVVIRDFSCVGNLVHCSTIWWLEYSSLHHTNICLPGIFVYLSSPIPDTHLEKKKKSKTSLGTLKIPVMVQVRIIFSRQTVSIPTVVSSPWLHFQAFIVLLAFFECIYLYTIPRMKSRPRCCW